MSGSIGAWTRSSRLHSSTSNGTSLAAVAAVDATSSSLDKPRALPGVALSLAVFGYIDMVALLALPMVSCDLDCQFLCISFRRS
mmetsp:Transcript_63307/g.76094  ORF Transcript_63307/g.76094 Transcript_63307/m.76094 type:complete len:84 (-) Transcript_63307:148-399(-)